MRILIAEDDPVLAEGLRQTLRHSGHAVDWVKDGVEADVALGTDEFDLLILDLSLPRLSGFEVLKRLRARASRLPVLLLTALDSVNDRVRGLDAGADDYLAKPFQLAELEARVRALTRRGMLGTTTLIKHGALCFDQVGRVATLGGERLELSARELSLLELFLQRPGRLVDKDQLVQHLCEWGEEVSTNAIEVYVHRLRKKLEPGGIRISTVRGVGYALKRQQRREVNGNDFLIPMKLALSPTFTATWRRSPPASITQRRWARSGSHSSGISWATARPCGSPRPDRRPCGEGAVVVLGNHDAAAIGRGVDPLNSMRRRDRLDEDATPRKATRVSFRPAPDRREGDILFVHASAAAPSDRST
jgi:two-component system OmpR family response regulator